MYLSNMHFNYIQPNVSHNNMNNIDLPLSLNTKYVNITLTVSSTVLICSCESPSPEISPHELIRPVKREFK